MPLILGYNNGDIRGSRSQLGQLDVQTSQFCSMGGATGLCFFKELDCGWSLSHFQSTTLSSGGMLPNNIVELLATREKYVSLSLSLIHVMELDFLA